MNDLVNGLLDHCKNNFSMKGKRVIITDTGGTTRRIPYDDFFKLKIEQENGYFSFKLNDKEGIDIMSFLLLGMCMSLSSLGSYAFELSDDTPTSKYLFSLVDYIGSDNCLVKSIEDYLTMSAKIEKIFINSPKTLKAIKKHASEEDFKSLYFAPHFGSSLFGPNASTMSNIMPYLICLSTTEEGRKKLIEAFCHFAPLIAFGGAQVFGGKQALQNTDDFSPLELMIVSTYFNQDRYLKFKYEKFKVNDSLEISDIGGISFLLAYYFVGELFFSHGRAELFKPNRDRVSDIFNNLLGNDYLRDYLIDGNINSLLPLSIKNKSVDYFYNNASYEIPMSEIYNFSKFFLDIDALGLDIDKLEGSNSLYEHFVSYKDCYFHLIRSGGSKLLLSYVDNITSIEKDFNKKVNYYKNRNSELSDRNKELSSTIKELNSDIENLKTFSTSVREEDHIELQKKLDMMQNKVDVLEEKCAKLESRYEESKRDMSDLLTSLECESEEDVSVSMEDMVEFLNGFSICFVGGRHDMGDKLHEMGLHNFTQLTSVNDVSRLNNFDFMISMTKFMSHKLFYSALGKCSERDKHHYFNGTNLNSLICSCYEFINKYFEIS